MQMTSSSEQKEHNNKENKVRDSSVNKPRTTTNKSSSVIGQNEFKQLAENLGDVNKEVLAKYKRKVELLEQDVSERDRTIASLKEQIIFLQKENMGLKLKGSGRPELNVDSASELSSQTRSTYNTSKNSDTGRSKKPEWNNDNGDTWDGYINNNVDVEIGLKNPSVKNTIKKSNANADSVRKSNVKLQDS